MGKTVLFCSNLYPPNFVGGAELIVASHARTLRQMGHQPVVFAGRSEPGLSHYAVTHDMFEGVPVYRVQLSCDDFDSRLVNFFHPPVDGQFEDLLVKCRADIVHLHNLIGLSLGVVHTAKRLGVPTVMTLHDFWGFCLKNTLIDADNRICEDFSRCHECQTEFVDNQRALPIRMRNDFMALQFAEIDAFISPSRFLADTYIRAGIPKHKMHVISNGVDVDRFSRIVKTRANGLVRFTLIGYLGEHKGVGTLLDAVTLLKERGSFRVNIVGDGHLRPALERQVQERGLSGLVKFWGKVKHSEIEAVFRETDVLILPSIWPENQPVSITEAMACRTPVIATRLGGNPELVRDGNTGYLVEPRSPADLARAMSRFLDAPESISALGERGFRSIGGNTFSNQVKLIVDLYEQIGSPA
jgi:glycosyltransferase involved in cell wall biosynthesis